MQLYVCNYNFIDVEGNKVTKESCFVSTVMESDTLSGSGVLEQDKKINYFPSFSGSGPILFFSSLF